ncbi:HNH endonuclease, partial [Vibrio diabolicus]|nr:HNH endonuclease [Vibrio diabolicus]
GHLLERATIDEDGKIQLKTINESKEGQIGEDGVEYVRKTIEVNGIEIEGVFPQFDSAIDVQLSDEMIQGTDTEQAKFGNQELKEKVQNDPEFAKQFNDEQLEQIENGDTPDGCTWHHNEEPGKMQLISTEDHQNNRHTGGKAIWGGGKENR